MKSLVSGIAVNRETTIERTDYYDDEKGNVILLLILLLLGAYGFVGAILTDFGITGYNFLICLLVLILCLVFSAVFYFEDYIKYTMPATLLLLITFVVSFYKMIYIGYYKTFGLVVDYLNSQYHKSFTVPIDLSGQPYALEMILFLMTMTFLICWILSVWIIYRPRASFLFLLYSPLLFVEVITGIAPHPLCLGMILFCILGTAVRGYVRIAFQKKPAIRLFSHHTQYNHLAENEFYLPGIQLRVVLYQGPLLLISAIIIYAFSIFPANAFFNANQKAMKAAVEASLIGGSVRTWARNENNPFAFLFASKGIGGIGDGTLGNIGSVQYSGQDALKVKTSSVPDDTLYLKAFTGEIYGKNRWTPSSVEKEYYEQFASFGADSLYDHNMCYEIIKGCTNVEETNSIDISVSNINADNTYTYLPYFSRVQSFEGAYIAKSFMNIKNNYDNFRTIHTSILERNNDSHNLLYMVYVLPEYLQLPDTGLERLKEQCEATGYYGLKDIAKIDQYIIDTLHNNTKYSLNPGVLPRGEEFTEYFLYEQKEGYCTHYATAATLMYRMFGIPARFIMGYSISPSYFSEDHSLGESVAVAYVKDEHAHAWTEIYLEGMGWVPIEVTPADMDYAWEEITAYESDTIQLMADTTQPKDKNTLSKNILKVLPYLILALTILFILFILSRSLYTYRKRFNKPDTAFPNEGIRQVYINLYQIFIFAGLSKTDNLSESELFDFVHEQFPFISRQQFGGFMDLILQANYSNHKLTDNDVKEAVAIYNCCHGYFIKQLAWYQKLRFQILCPVPR